MKKNPVLTNRSMLLTGLFLVLFGGSVQTQALSIHSTMHDQLTIDDPQEMELNQQRILQSAGSSYF